MQCERKTGSQLEGRELAASLRHLLEAQLAAGREGNLVQVERLGERASAVVEAIVRNGGAVWTEAEGGRDLEKLYGELILLLRAQQADVQNRLTQLRRVKRAIGAYGPNDKSVRKSSLQLG